ncbi:unnamed protein product [Phytomonas sp. EM1]|nr:unnamed protein product [Phytomonas sp. EM1]|eukprot:CCW63990.1 unnamed protein product [Phytomonas sp. isolate EM1]
MKLLKFVNCDAPQTFSGVELTSQRLSFPSSTSPAGKAKAWSLQPAPATLKGGGYWLLDDDGKPIGVLDEVLLAIPEEGKEIATSSSLPRGVITPRDIQDLDFRSKLGRQLERTRAEYGVTYKTAAKSARALMDTAEINEKRQERMKREREAVVEAIEAGESVVDKAKTKRVKSQAK